MNRLLAAFAALMFSVAPALAARTDITVQTSLNPNGTIGANAANLTETAADVSNGNQFAMSGGEIVIVHNTGGSPYTVTITSAPDSLGRTKDITTYSVAATTKSLFGPFNTHGWRQSNGKMYLDASNAAIKYSIIRPYQ